MFAAPNNDTHCLWSWVNLATMTGIYVFRPFLVCSRAYRLVYIEYIKCIFICVVNDYAKLSGRRGVVSRY